MVALHPSTRTDTVKPHAAGIPKPLMTLSIFQGMEAQEKIQETGAGREMSREKGWGAVVEITRKPTEAIEAAP